MAQLQATGITGSLTASGNLQINGGNITTAGNDLTLAPASTNIYLQGKVGITSELTVGAAAAIAGQLLVSGTITTLSPTTVLNISASNSINLAKNTTITGTLSSSGNITTAGNLAVNGGDITSTAAILNINAGGTLAVQDNLVITGTLSSSGDITTAGNLAANGGIVKTAAAILTLRASSSAPYPPWNYGTVDVYGDTHLYNDLQVDGGNIGTIVANLSLSASNSINLVKDTRVTGTLTTTGDLFVKGGDATIASSTTKQAILNLSSSQYGGVINTYGSSSTSNLSFKAEENQVMSLLNSPSLGTKLTIEDPFSNGAKYSIKAGANEVAQFIVSGAASIGTIVSEDFYLSTANTARVKIGSSSADLTLLAGNLVFGTAGKGIDFSATTSASVMTSELLDDYEEGTWSPVISGSTTAGSFTYDRSGFYTKIGNMVHIHAYINVSTVITTPTGSLNITGLPFAATGGAFAFRSTAVMFTDLRGTTGVTVAQGNIATSVIQIWKNSIATTALLASDLSPASGLGIVWSLNGSYRV